MSNRSTDYIFDEVKFSSFEGKTGPYLLYTDVRIKSILNKIDNKDYKFINISNLDMKNVLLKILELPNILNRSYLDKSLNPITDFLFDLCSLFNKFYNNYSIIKEENIDIKSSYLALIKLVKEVLEQLLDILAIEVVDRM